MGAADVLESMEKFPEMLESQTYLQLLANFKKHASTLSKLQSVDGRWHNILNQNETFLETSCSAMNLYSFIKGLKNGWLDESEFCSKIDKAWKGILQVIDYDGTVFNIIGETAIKDSAAKYAPDSTKYADSAPGLGAVLRGISAMIRFEAMKEKQEICV